MIDERQISLAVRKIMNNSPAVQYFIKTFSFAFFLFYLFAEADLHSAKFSRVTKVTSLLMHRSNYCARPHTTILKKLKLFQFFQNLTA